MIKKFIITEEKNAAFDSHNLFCSDLFCSSREYSEILFLQKCSLAFHSDCLK